MRIALIASGTLMAAVIAFVAGFATASLWAEEKPADKSVYSTGRTQTPETLGQKQPQGWTGPVGTGSGGTPASSPQGRSPPNMQSASEGSSKMTAAPDRNK